MVLRSVIIIAFLLLPLTGFAENYYERLKIPPGSSAEEVKKAYRKRSIELHPDRLKARLGREPTAAEIEESSREFQKVNEAYETLSDEVRKAHYDHRFSIAKPRKEKFDLSKDGSSSLFSDRNPTPEESEKRIRDWFAPNDEEPFVPKTAEEEFLVDFEKNKFFKHSLTDEEWKKIMTILERDSVDPRVYRLLNDALYRAELKAWPVEFWRFIDSNLPLIRQGQVLYGLNDAIRLQKTWPDFFTDHMKKVLSSEVIAQKSADIGVRNMKLAIVENLLSRENVPSEVVGPLKEFLQAEKKSDLYDRAMYLIRDYRSRPLELDDLIAKQAPSDFRVVQALLQKDTPPPSLWTALNSELSTKYRSYDFRTMLLYSTKFNPPVEMSEVFWRELATKVKHPFQIELISRAYQNSISEIRRSHTPKFSRLSCQTEPCFKNLVSILDSTVKLDAAQENRIQTWHEVREIHENFENEIVSRVSEVSTAHPDFLKNVEVRNQMKSILEESRKSYRWNKNPPTEKYLQIETLYQRTEVKIAPITAAVEEVVEKPTVDISTQKCSIRDVLRSFFNIKKK